MDGDGRWGRWQMDGREGRMDGERELGRESRREGVRLQ